MDDRPRTDVAGTDVAGRALWIDAGSGVAGDMLLGALVDAGAALASVQAAVDAVAPATVRLSAREVRRAGLRATKVDIELIAPDLPSRTWADVRVMLTTADLPTSVRDRALAVFTRLAAAEGRVHGVPVEQVHFHEVGAWDSIADVVGCVAALHSLGVAHVSAGPLALGSGTVATAHGELPVPVPAVLELTAGWRVRTGGAGELATPTGAALVTGLASRCEDLPEMTVLATACGAGSRDPAGRPNLVRVVVGTPAPAPGSPSDEGADRGTDRAVLIEANVDDLDPRVWPSVLAGLMAAGASDAWLTPILMKKGRPAHTLSALATPEHVPGLRDAIFGLVPTFGLREAHVRKTALARAWLAVDVAGTSIRIKPAHDGERIVSATPEYEDVRRAAEQRGLPVRHVLDRAVASAHAAGLVPGGPVPDGLVRERATQG